MNVEELLLNIESLTDEQKQQLKNIIVEYNFIDTSDYLMNLYNQLSEAGSKVLIELVGYQSLTKDFITKFKNIQYIIPPYNYDYYSFYSYIFESKELTLIAINSDIFYKELTDNFKIERVFKELSDNDLRKIFINKCLNNIIGEYKYFDPAFRLYVKEHVSDDKIIEFQQNNDDIDEILNAFPMLSDKGQEIVYNSEWFRNKVNLDLFVNQEFLLANSCESIIKDVSEKVKFSTIFIDLYGNSKPRNIMFLKLFLDKYSGEIMLRQLQPIYIITDKIYDLLGSEYQEKLKNFFNSLHPKEYLELYFKYYMTFENQSIELKKIMFNKACELLENNMITETLSPTIIKSNDQELLNLIIKHVSKEDLLMLSIRNEYICDYVLELLKNNPSYFKDIIINDNMKFSISTDIKEDKLNKYLKIFKYLDKEQYKIYFLPLFFEKVPGIKDLYKQEILKNPDSIIKLSDLQYVESDIDSIINRMSIDKLMYLIVNRCGDIKKIADKIRVCIDKRVNEVIEFINNDYIELDERYHFSVTRIIYLVSDKEKFVKSINNIDLLCYIFDDTNNSSIKKMILNRLANIYNCNEFESPKFMFPVFFNQDKEQEEFISSIDFDVLLYILCNEFKYDNHRTKRFKPYIDYICKSIDKDINILFNDINSIIMVDNILLYLPNDYQNKIKSYIDNKYSLCINKYDNLRQYIKTYSDKANFINAIEKGLINSSNINDIYKLLEKNIYLFNSMDFNLLNDDIKKMGYHFIEKTSRHPILANKLYKIYLSDLNKFNLIINLSNKLIRENSENIYDQKIENIINYLYSNNINIDFEINDETLSNIENYILENSTNNHKFKNLSMKNYTIERNKILDEEINKCNDIESLKDYIYQRYFWLNSEGIKDFLIGYAFNFNSVLEFCDSDLPNKYINYIKTIQDITDIDELKKIVSKLNEFTLSDYMIIKGIMIRVYNKSIISDIKNMQNGTNITLNIDGEEIVATELSNNFGIFGHSTCAYGTMPIINDDYYDSWNYNPNTSNHGICTFLMTEYSYGTPEVTDTGVLFGFIVDDEGIPLIAPYDLATINTGYNIRSTMKPFFGRLNTISNFTRHTHSEASLERRVTDKFNNSSIRQPNCIIILEDMPDNIKRNSLKAYHDFKKHGIDLKIIYVNRKKIATNASVELSNMIKSYLNNYDLELLMTIINLYECNLCSCTFIGKRKSNSLELFDEHELFFTKEITSILNYTIERLEQSHNIDEINHFIDIMKSEQFKFDLVNDFNKKRSNKFDLYTDNMRKRVEQLETISKVK